MRHCDGVYGCQAFQALRFGVERSSSQVELHWVLSQGCSAGDKWMVIGNKAALTGDKPILTSNKSILTSNKPKLTSNKIQTYK